MLKMILIGIAVVLVVLMVVIAMQPATFSLERTAVINAPPAAAFAQVNDFHNWAAWSPWEKMDLSMKKTFEGPLLGEGAVYAWVGNKQVGEGRMTILESLPNESVRIKLEFLKPFKATNDTLFTFAPQGNQTAVTWRMSGNLNFMMKAFHLFVNMDKMVGKDFEKGLANMKTVVEVKK